MFEKVMALYIGLSLICILVLALVPSGDDLVELGELEDHVGRTVAVEALSVSNRDGDTVLWDDGTTVHVYGANDHPAGSFIRVKGTVRQGADPYIVSESLELISAPDPIEVHHGQEGAWVHSKGTLEVLQDIVSLDVGGVSIDVVFHFKTYPADGLPLEVSGVLHDNAVQVFGRDCVHNTDVLDSPWTVTGNITMEGIVSMEPRTGSLTLNIIDGSIRVRCNTSGVHMQDAVRFEGALEYERPSARFVAVGGVHLIRRNGPVNATPEMIADTPWLYDGAHLQVIGNLSTASNGYVDTPAGRLIVLGPAPVNGSLYGTLMLGPDLRYVVCTS